MPNLSRLRNRYLNLSLRYKLFFWLVPLLIVAIGSIGYSSYLIASNQLLDKIEQQQSDTAETTMSHLDYVARNVSDLFNYLYLSNELRDFLLSKPGDANLYSTRNYAFQAIDRLVVTQDYLQSLIIYPLSGEDIEFTHQGVAAALPASQFKRTGLFRRVMANPDVPIWDIESSGSKLFIGDNETKVIYARVLKDDTTQIPIGVVIIGINEKDIRSTYSSRSTPEAETLITDANGTVLSESSGKWLGQNIRYLPFFPGKPFAMDRLNAVSDRKRWLFSEASSTLTGWHTLILEPKSILLAQIKHIQLITLSVIFTCFLLLLPLSWLISSAVTRPIQRLLTSMRKVQLGDLTQSVAVDGKDELGLLANTYNTMISRIKQLIDEVYNTNIMKREAELKLLQSQINPHFLYNTLDTICWTAEQRQEPEIAEMAYSLGQIFRISLSDGKDIIPLEREIKLVSHYLQLQKIRFHNRFSYHIEVDPTSIKSLVPKLILQPFVENAIIHGIEPLQDSGFIQILTRLENRRTILEVTDNGVGMPDSPVQGDAGVPPAPVGGDPPRKGYALANCRERLRLLYGDAAHIGVESTPGLGTRIRITLPA